VRVYVQELTRFKGLYDRINEEALVILSKCKLPAKKMINHLISVELAYINTNHPDFIGGSGALGGLFEKLAQVQRDEQRMIQQGAAAAAAGGPQSGPPARLTSGPAAAMRPSNARSFGDDVRTADPLQRTKQSPWVFTLLLLVGGCVSQRPGPPRLPQVPITIKATAPMTDKEQFETELIRMYTRMDHALLTRSLTRLNVTCVQRTY